MDTELWYFEWRKEILKLQTKLVLALFSWIRLMFAYIRLKIVSVVISLASLKLGYWKTQQINQTYLENDLVIAYYKFILGIPLVGI